MCRRWIAVALAGLLVSGCGGKVAETPSPTKAPDWQAESHAAISRELAAGLSQVERAHQRYEEIIQARHLKYGFARPSLPEAGAPPEFTRRFTSLAPLPADRVLKNLSESCGYAFRIADSARNTPYPVVPPFSKMSAWAVVGWINDQIPDRDIDIDTVSKEVTLR